MDMPASGTHQHLPALLHGAPMYLLYNLDLLHSRVAVTGDETSDLGTPWHKTPTTFFPGMAHPGWGLRSPAEGWPGEPGKALGRWQAHSVWEPEWGAAR